MPSMSVGCSGWLVWVLVGCFEVAKDEEKT